MDSYLERYGVIKIKRKSAPKSDKKSRNKTEKRLSKLRRGKFRPTLECDIILDDESYFTLKRFTKQNDSYFCHQSLETSKCV
jgi:hypothetical protein